METLESLLSDQYNIAVFDCLRFYCGMEEIPQSQIIKRLQERNYVSEVSISAMLDLIDKNTHSRKLSKKRKKELKEFILFFLSEEKQSLYPFEINP